ncbi:MAG: hypothetical protein R3C14_08205 [Caldilineaceae bacterium]
MTSELLLRRKWTLRAHGRQVVLVKKPIEHSHHVLMKAFLWALYLPTYPDLKVEIAIGDRYKPDVVALATDPHGDSHTGPLFWGEAGQVSPEKLRALAKRYRTTHFALAKWSTNLPVVVSLVTNALAGIARQAPFDVLLFPPDSAERFIDESGQITLTHADLVWTRLLPDVP